MPLTSDLLVPTVGLIGTVIIISSLLSGLIEKSGLPQVAVFLGLGALIGPIGLGFVNVDVHSPMLRAVGTLSLVLVLFTDAVSLNLSEVRGNRRLAILMLGPGTLISAVLIAVMACWLLGLNTAAAFILGAALASTDPVLLRGLIRRPGVDERVKQALRLEGGMNDAVLLPVVLIGITLWQQAQPLTGMEWGHLLLKILIVSPAAGVVVGLAAVAMLELIRKHAAIRRDYESIYSLGVAFAAFAAAEAFHGSGFLAAFAAGLTVSSLDVELCDCFLEYGETTAEMALMFAFVLFGIGVIWSGIAVAGPATLLFTAAVFAARPAAFLIALIPTPLSWKDRSLIAWFGPRGLSTLLLIMLAVNANVPGSAQLVSICCLIVLFSVVLHGFTPNVLLRERKVRSIQGATGDFCPLNFKSDNKVTTLPSKEFISIDEIQNMRNENIPVVIVDSRTERTYEDSTDIIPESIRVHPDHPVTEAKRLGVSKDLTLAILCACNNEATSSRVTRQLQKAGWTGARALRGGWAVWVDSGLPHVAKPAA